MEKKLVVIKDIGFLGLFSGDELTYDEKTDSYYLKEELEDISSSNHYRNSRYIEINKNVANSIISAEYAKITDKFEETKEELSLDDYVTKVDDCYNGDCDNVEDNSEDMMSILKEIRSLLKDK